MTRRLYYDDAYLTRFKGHVLEQFSFDDKFGVVLDQTAFYPTSGGQPFDCGILGGVKVVDVVVRESDDAVLHILEAPLNDQPAAVLGEIDWGRRFDHMQQHTGQHILSQAFLHVAQAETVSFHLGAQSATIDLSGPRHLSSADMEQTELLTNKIVWEDRPVATLIVNPAELDSVPLRKPPAVSGAVRVIQVADFDWSACGGTHVARTGEIGLIKIIKWERRGAETRIEFRCGWRAVMDYARKNDIVNRVSAGFNVGYWELDQAVERLATEAKELRARLRQAGQALSAYRADELRANAQNVAAMRLVVHNLTKEPLMDLRELARCLVSEPGVVAVLGTGVQKTNLCFARSPDVGIDMVPLMRDIAETLGSRGGGGKPDFAQGGGTLENAQQLDVVLESAARKVREQLTRAE
jgi:alanyl-tRNA synthetase